MDDRLFEQINQQTNIVDLVSEFVELQKAGKNFKGLCPFHNDSNPSFFVSPEKNIAKCMSCGGGGQPLTFYRQIKNIPFQQAVEELAKKAGIHVPNAQPKSQYEQVFSMFEETQKFYVFTLRHTEQGKKALDYLYKRGLTDEAIDHFEIGVAPNVGDSLYQVLRDKKFSVNQMLDFSLVRQRDDGSYYDLFVNRITFPVKNMQGKIVGFSARTLEKDNQVKYMNSPESAIFKKGQLLYHAFDAQQDIRKNQRVIIHEGFFDVISSYQAGYKEAVATMGTALTSEQCNILAKLSKNIIIAYDGDKAGLEATNKAIKKLEPLKLKVDILHLPDQLDPDEFIKKHGIQAYQKRMQHLKDPYDYRYLMYKQSKDLSKSHDRIAFKDAVIMMLEGSDETVKALYKQRLAVDLNISPEDLKISPKVKQIIPKKESKRSLKNKYMMSEIGLIIAMMQSKDFAVKAHDELSNEHFADRYLSMIRYHIIKFYETNDTFDLALFMKELSDDYLTILESDVLSDMDYVNNLKKSADDVDNYITEIKRSLIIRRIKKLNEQRKERPDNAPLIVTERDNLLKNMNGVK